MYFLTALVGQKRIVSELESRMNATTRLMDISDGLAMLPLPTNALAWINKDDDDVFIVKGYDSLSVKLYSILISFSKIGKIGYIEAEYFGGDGGQSSILFSESEPILEKVNTVGAINSLLSSLGIVPEPGKDEFDTVGFGKNRRTEDWLR